MNDIHNVIKNAKFGDDRFRGLGVVAGQISAFAIDFAGRPYNTLTLPCERVIIFIVEPPKLYSEYANRVQHTKNVIVFHPLLTGHVIRRTRSGRARIFTRSKHAYRVA